MPEANIRGLQSIDAYIADRSVVFPSRESWRWFERTHRLELMKAGALTAPTGKKLVDPVITDAIVARVGHERVLSLAER
jgi:hypothetical protein